MFFEAFKFKVYASLMYSNLKIAAQASDVGDLKRSLEMIRKAVAWGYKALAIPIPKVIPEQRSTVESAIERALRVYRKGYVALMSDEDRDLLISAIDLWNEVGKAAFAADPADHVSAMFKVAKGRLDKDKQILKFLYDDDQTPPVLRNIMSRFVFGKATREQTETRLDECYAKLKGWMGDLYIDF